MTERDPNPLEPPLSQQGMARRAQIRGKLLAELSRTRASRDRLRRTAAGAAAGAALALALVLALLRPAATQLPGAGPRIHVVGSSGVAFSRWAVGTDPDPLNRAAAGAELPVGSLIVVVDDDTLVRTLAAIGRPSGIVRSGGQAWMATSVIDPPDGG